MLAILYWTADSWTVDSERDSGQWTVDSGQTDCPILDNGTLDSGHGGWTVDGTEWTEALSLL